MELNSGESKQKTPVRMRAFPSIFTSVRFLIDYWLSQLDTQASKEKRNMWNKDVATKVTVSEISIPAYINSSD